MYYIFLPLSLLFKAISILLGWKSPPQSMRDKLNSRNRKVIVFSHTSYWDFWIMFLYILSEPDMFKDVYTVMKPQPFEGLFGIQGLILDKLGFIPSTRKEESGKGFVKKAVRHLKDKERFSLLISPKGTISLVPKWRSGYFHIAKILNTPVISLGFDYEKKGLVVQDYIDVNNYTLKDCNMILIDRMSEIVPLNPELTLSRVRSHRKEDVSPIDSKRVFMLLELLAVNLLFSGYSPVVDACISGYTFTTFYRAFLNDVGSHKVLGDLIQTYIHMQYILRLSYSSYLTLLLKGTPVVLNLFFIYYST